MTMAWFGPASNSVLCIPNPFDSSVGRPVVTARPIVAPLGDVGELPLSVVS
jgi:hypothetical protein